MEKLALFVLALAFETESLGVPVKRLEVRLDFAEVALMCRDTEAAASQLVELLLEKSVLLQQIAMYRGERRRRRVSPCHIGNLTGKRVKPRLGPPSPPWR